MNKHLLWASTMLWIFSALVTSVHSLKLELSGLANDYLNMSFN
jgi:hypothetical protein